LPNWLTEDSFGSKFRSNGLNFIWRDASGNLFEFHRQNLDSAQASGNQAGVQIDGFLTATIVGLCRMEILLSATTVFHFGGAHRILRNLEY
jgi:hypothetical protein